MITTSLSLSPGTSWPAMTHSLIVQSSPFHRRPIKDQNLYQSYSDRTDTRKIRLHDMMPGTPRRTPSVVWGPGYQAQRMHKTFEWERKLPQHVNVLESTCKMAFVTGKRTTIYAFAGKRHPRPHACLHSAELISPHKRAALSRSWRIIT